ncbi:unnamed protein product [Hyaloperonospora brassicae]|uniref:FYVE-type domain-containing protein n=1 Tax=Hyaloperonospora brassicae TaxID=162125 RepID=A0AAV0URK7_HYABA|nr:unnamed protein product [Hyaloperonospora brassicae]
MADDLVLPDQSPFAPLQLTFDEQRHCHDLSLQLLERTLHSYDERLAGITPRHHASLDSARWKLQKTEEHASLYSERMRRVRTDLHLPEDQWDDPTVLLMVGTIHAPLDEVMLGMTIPTFEALQLRVATLGNQDISGAMLAKLSRATAERPFEHLSILYMASRLPWLVSKVVKPRDFLLLSASGIVTTAEGERIGYDLLQPAPLPQCRPLPKPMIRGKFMIGCLYRELEDGTVDVYIQQYLEPLGKVFDSFVIAGTWQALLGFLRSPLLAESKKLQWCIARVDSRRRQRGRLVDERSSSSVRCSLCFKACGRAGHSRSSDPQRCVLCFAHVCSHCREEREFKVLKRQVKKKSMIAKRQVWLCRPCLEFVQRQKASDIARYSVLDSVTPASTSAAMDSSTGRMTWGLLDSDSVPSWSPSQSLSVSSESFESFSW